MSTTEPQAEFTDEEIAIQSMRNARATGLALIVHGREHGETPDQVGRWLGAIFAPGWEEIRGQGARPAARAAARNSVSLGGELRQLSGDEREAQATLAGWPDQAILDYFSVSRDEADALFTVFEPIAEHLGLDYRWQREGDAVTLTFARQGA